MEADSNDVVLSFQDSLLRKSDVRLLEEGQWLNDRIIGFMFEYFEYEQFKDLKDVLFVNPDVAQYIKLCKGEIFLFVEPLQLHTKKTLFLPVNSNTNPGAIGGTHWSLLVYDKTKNRFSHYDSVASFNNAHARVISNAIEPFLEVQSKVDFVEEHCPQQLNLYDCGVYVISITELLCQGKQNNLEKQLDDHLTDTLVKEKRKEIKGIISSLKMS